MEHTTPAYTSSLAVLWYDTFNPPASPQEVDWYLNHLKNATSILELMCGSGRLLLPLHQHGINIEGVDNSKAMLNKLMYNAQKQHISAPPIYLQSVENLQLNKTFDAIIIAYGSFQLLAQDAARKTVQNIHQHLKPGGLLLLDLFIPTTIFNTTTTQDSFEVPINTHTMLTLKRTHHIDLQNQTIRSEHYYQLLNQGVVTNTESETIITRWYTDTEITALLTNTGFCNISIIPVPFEQDPPGFLISAYRSP